MGNKSKQGKVAMLMNVTEGTLIVGDAATPLADNSWFKNVTLAPVGSTLPLKVSYMWKSPDSGNAITPILVDDVYPLTFEKICKVDLSLSTESGTIDVTDDCSDGYNQMILDGFTTISGSFGGFFKYSETDGSLPTVQKEFLNRFFDIVDDDGEGTYTLSPKKDTNIILAILKNSDETDVGFVQQWQLIPALISSMTMDNPLKGVQNLDASWTKAEGAASQYSRITNATETVLPF
jgi:hypothetical protein